MAAIAAEDYYTRFNKTTADSSSRQMAMLISVVNSEGDEKFENIRGDSG